MTTYTTSAKVALLTKNLIRGATDFNKETPIDKARVDQFISWVSSSIDMKFSQAGFKIPLVAISGEIFPPHQTSYLEFLASLGVVAMIYPSITPNRNSREPAESNFSVIFKDEINRIYSDGKHHLKFRADFYHGTPAEVALTEPLGPKSDWSEGLVDPTRYLTLDQYTRLINKIKDSFVDPEWDYLRSLHDNGLEPIKL